MFINFFMFYNFSHDPSATSSNDGQIADTSLFLKDSEQNMGNKSGKRPCIAKRTMSVKKVMYMNAILSTTQIPAIQAPRL